MDKIKPDIISFWALVSIPLFLIGCSDNIASSELDSHAPPDTSVSSDSVADTDSATGIQVSSDNVIVSSTDSSTDTVADAVVDTATHPPLAFATMPNFKGNDNTSAPLAGILSLETNQTAQLTISVTSADGESWTLQRTAGPGLTEPILGLKPQTTYTVSVTASVNDQQITENAGEWTTPALPDSFPRLQIISSNAARMEPGMIMFNPWNDVNSDDKPLVVVDNSGTVRWFYDGAPVFDDHHLLANGNVLFAPDECLMQEVDMLGNTVRSWVAVSHPVECDAPKNAIPVAIDSFHHAMDMLHNGNFLVLSSEMREVENFPTSEESADADIATERVMGSIIVEFTPDGQIIKYIPLLDLLDPTRIGRGVLRDSWSLLNKYRLDGDRPKDWDHANALIYDEAEDAYYVSVRHQDAIIKVNRTAETLEWILGTPANWQSPWAEKLLAPKGEIQWFFHQHAVTFTDRGLGLYDNGNYGAPAFEPEKDAVYSRAVLFSIDETAGTASQIWAYGPPSGEADSVYSRAMGNADFEATTTGNVLISNGWASGGPVGTYSRIVEVTEAGEIVFELLLQGDDEEDDKRYAMHRARRIADLRQ
ncbi:MAG: aryl-sulfate sulfotransferase [Deltaproteobacteria bacterium]|nr:aryl-sulfate sulfotransferase [Deltaproteobacteria bacterium]